LLCLILFSSILRLLWKWLLICCHVRGREKFIFSNGTNQKTQETNIRTPFLTPLSYTTKNSKVNLKNKLSISFCLVFHLKHISELRFCIKCLLKKKKLKNYKTQNKPNLNRRKALKSVKKFKGPFVLDFFKK
jgi:hypothetical protein